MPATHGVWNARAWLLAGMVLVSTIAVSLALSATTSAKVSRGEAGGDVLRGSRFDDTMYGFRGPDRIYGRSGNDAIDGATGPDRCSAAPATTASREGSPATDSRAEPATTPCSARRQTTACRGDGDDNLDGATAPDLLRGGPGNDVLDGRQLQGPPPRRPRQRHHLFRRAIRVSDRVIDCGSGYDVVSGDPNDRKRSRIRDCERFDVGQAPPSAPRRVSSGSKRATTSGSSVPPSTTPFWATPAESAGREDGKDVIWGDHVPGTSGNERSSAARDRHHLRQQRQRPYLRRLWRRPHRRWRRPRPDQLRPGMTPCSESRVTTPVVARSSAERSPVLDSITLDGARQNDTTEFRQRKRSRASRTRAGGGGQGGWPIDDPEHKRSGGPHSGARTPREEQLSAWLSAYGRAWEQRDPAAVADLFTAEASYEISPSPFPQPLKRKGRRYSTTGWPPPALTGGCPSTTSCWQWPKPPESCAGGRRSTRTARRPGSRAFTSRGSPVTGAASRCGSGGCPRQARGRTAGPAPLPCARRRCLRPTGRGRAPAPTGPGRRAHARRPSAASSG